MDDDERREDHAGKFNEGLYGTRDAANDWQEEVPRELIICNFTFYVMYCVSAGRYR